MNKTTTAIAALCLALFAGNALAATDAAPKSKQQGRMATCSKEAKAKDLHKDARKQFMSTCLKAKA